MKGQGWDWKATYSIERLRISVEIKIFYEIRLLLPASPPGYHLGSGWLRVHTLGLDMSFMNSGFFMQGTMTSRSSKTATLACSAVVPAVQWNFTRTLDCSAGLKGPQMEKPAYKITAPVVQSDPHFLQAFLSQL